MNTDEFINAVFDGNGPGEDPRETEARALPGANFASVYGRVIYHNARRELMAKASRYDWSERDRDAYWPTALTRAMSIHASSGIKHGVDGTPTESEIETARERAGHFLDGWKVMTGNDMNGGLLSAHDRLALAPSVPVAFRNQARELRDEGVCQYVDRCLALGLDMRHGERNRADGQQGGDGDGGRPAQRIRQRQRVR